MPKTKEEYEVVPLSPIRRLEKRVEELEKATKGGEKEFFREMVSIIRLNQEIVSELVKANDALRMELARVVPRVEELVSKLNELLEYIKTAASEETPAQAKESNLDKKIEELIESNKKISETLEEMLNSLEEVKDKLKRPPIVIKKKPLISPTPKI